MSKRDNGLLVKLMAVFVLLAVAVNLVADAFMLHFQLDPVSSLLVLAICILVSILILGDRIAEAF